MAWQAASASEKSYASKLRMVARQIGLIVTGYSPTGELSAQDELRIRYALDHYANLLKPWAQSVARFMLADVDRRNLSTWQRVGKEIGRALGAEIREAPTGMLMQALLDQNVELITSLPKKAAQRVHEITTASIQDGRRADEIAKQILATGKVTASRATLIARTEVSRAQHSLTQARAMYAGSEGYIWRTSKDEAVRPTHRPMEGRYVRWDAPPKTDKNLDPYHAGCGPNCRCYPEPLLPDYNLID